MEVWGDKRSGNMESHKEGDEKRNRKDRGQGSDTGRRKDFVQSSKSRRIKGWMASRQRLWQAALACLLFIVAVITTGMFPSSAKALAAPKDGEETFSPDSANQAARQRVFDQAGLFTAREKDELEQEIQELREILKMDVVLVTTEDAQGKNAEQYADDFYDSYGFGVGEDFSGVLYLMDMDNRELYISTSGEMIRILTDERIENMQDNGIGYMKDQRYEGCARQLLQDTQFWYEEGIEDNQYNIDRDTGEVSPYQARPKRSIRWYELLLAFGVSAFCAGSVCGKVKRDYAMNQERKQAANYYMAYRADAAFRFRNQDDVLSNSHITRQRIPRSTPASSSGGSGHSGRSTTHQSSSGRSHGGGGRKF